MPSIKKTGIAILGLSISALNEVQGGVSFGKCPAISTIHDLDISKYQGRWYEIQRDKSMIFELGLDCVTATYGLKDDGLVSVYNRGYYYPFSSLADFVSLHGEAKCDSATGTCIVTFFGKKTDGPVNY